jgi:hypothetical protein
MKSRYLFITLFIVQFFVSCDHFEKHVKKVEVVVEDSELVQIDGERVFEPPPPGNTLPKPVTLQEWFSGICDTVKPASPTTTYQFVLLQTDSIYLITLFDRTPLENTKKLSMANYATLSKTEYKNMDIQQALGKIKSQLKEFSKSDTFRNSSLAKIGGITIRFSDQEVVQLK